MSRLIRAWLAHDSPAQGTWPPPTHSQLIAFDKPVDLQTFQIHTNAESCTGDGSTSVKPVGAHCQCQSKLVPRPSAEERGRVTRRYIYVQRSALPLVELLSRICGWVCGRLAFPGPGLDNPRGLPSSLH
eukprot:3391774-Prymnesium_polylepis.1